MAAPEAPVKYVGILKESAAFRLMKSMVSSIFFSWMIVVSVEISLKGMMFWNGDIFVCRDGKKEKDLVKTSKGSKAMSESRTNKTQLVRFFFFVFFILPVYCM